MRRLLAVFVAVGALGVAAVPASATTASPARSASPPTSPSPSPTPDPAVTASLQSRIGGDLANALASQQRLAGDLAATSRREQQLNEEVAATDARIEQLDAQIAELEGRIDDTQKRIEVERAEVAALARALYRRPTSLLLVFARSRSLADALARGSDLVVAGRYAHSVEARLQADLEKLNEQHRALDADRQQEQALRDSLDAQLADLEGLLSRQQDLADALGSMLTQFQAALTALPTQPADVTAQLLGLLEQQVRSLNAASFEQAWAQARVGAAAVQVLTIASVPISGVALAAPEPGAVLTQPFGPTDLWFEPPLGAYPHFHTGVDLAAPAGSPVLAAADGVVTVVADSTSGYGRYVIVAHAGGVQTLYAHLEAFAVQVGERVTAGEPIGAEGSSGFSTGPHLHFEVRVNDALVDPLPLIAAPSRS